ncbi:MAG: 23S rRNA (guanosine(2251)-2'-O)-methyltransferase RlmB [Kordiimonadaceae bacterium]|nr:23S rRNA (guanosine(2251)-2'-O)-methyltransferase RlmB [Kordiimonadaceae bacterium]
MTKKKNKPNKGQRTQPNRPAGNERRTEERAPRRNRESANANAPSSSHAPRSSAPQGMEQAHALTPTSRNSYFLFGRNSVQAALANKSRECVRLIGTEKSLADCPLPERRSKLPIETHKHTGHIAASVPEGSPHQGILLEVRPLPGLDLQDLEPNPQGKNIILMLDQVTDPHNVGACMRSAAAFGARALITQDRNSPDEGGVLARSAAGALEILPWLKVANLAQALDTLRHMGYWHVGLDGNTEQSIRTLKLGDNIVIVMGSEGKGLRPLVRKNCDVIAKIPMQGAVESLNVSNAAAISLYQLVE